jgi:hypothetical protein
MRVQIASVQMKTDYKWSVTIEVIDGTPGREHLLSSVETAALFESEDAAYAAGNRALDTFQTTGMFPNMLEEF